MADLIGQSLGRYHILEQLGEGGMAVVYKAFDTRLERNVAIKVILPGKAQKDKFLKRFEREAKALASLSHPNIVKVIDYGEHEGMPYLVMEYIPGGTLKQKLNGKQISWQEAIRLLIPIAKALSYAHDNKIIHRDIKPANILITQSGEPMLSDFGIAKILEVEETLDLTGMGVGIGTPEYMSPEQAQGKLVDARADVYSLGVVFYEMITGRRPYQADTPMAVVWKLASEPLPRPKNYVDGLPDFIDQLLLKALSKDPKDRFQDMHEFSAALEMRLAMNKGKVHEKPKVGRPPALGIAAVIILILIAVAFAVLKYRTGTQAVPDNLTELAETSQVSSTPQSPSQSPLPAVTRAEGPVSYKEGAILASEDFEDGQIQITGFGQDSNRWTVVDEVDGNKVFQVDNRDGNQTPSIAFGEDIWTDYVTEYRVKYLTESGSVGIQVRTNTASNYYTVDVGPGRMNMEYYSIPTGTVHMTTTYPSLERDVWHDFKLIVLGNRIQVYLDSKMWIDQIDSKSSHGAILMFGSPSVLAQIDNLKVTAISADSSTENHLPTVTPPTSATTQIMDITTLEQGTYLASEDFEDEQVQISGFSTDSDRWQIVSDAEENKVFQIDNRGGTGYSGFAFGEGRWADYLTEYRIKFLDRAGEIGLQVRMESGGSYILNVSTGGTYLAYATPAEWIRFESKLPPISLNDWHTVKMVVYGPQIQVYIDDRLWFEQRDTRYQKGELMIFADIGTFAQLDDLKVIEIK